MSQERNPTRFVAGPLFGFACGALGQFWYYADFMRNPVVLLVMLVVGVVITVLSDEY